MAVTIQQKASAPTTYSNHLDSPTAAKMQVTPGLAHVQLEVKEGKLVVKQHQGEEVVHKGVATAVQPAMVSVGGSRTVQPKPYESVKLSVTLTMPSHPDAIDKTYDFCTEWVSARLELALKEAGLL